MARILIAGCGDVGVGLGIRLVQAGHEVWGLKRNPATLPAMIHPIAADLAQPQDLAHLPPALDYVFYTAAAGGTSEHHYQVAYLDGVGHLLDALENANQPVKRVFLTSSTSVYVQCNGEWVDEDSPAEPETVSGRCLRGGEDLVWNGPYPGTVVRFGGIYGPGRTRLLDSLRNGTATCVENPPVYTNRIHRDDCVAVLHHLLGLSKPSALYLGVDHAPAPQCEVLRWLAHRLGVPGPTVVSSASDPETRMRANKRCKNNRLCSTGYQFRYPTYQEGYGALLAAADSAT